MLFTHLNKICLSTGTKSELCLKCTCKPVLLRLACYIITFAKNNDECDTLSNMSLLGATMSPWWRNDLLHCLCCKSGKLTRVPVDVISD